MDKLLANYVPTPSFVITSANSNDIFGLKNILLYNMQFVWKQIIHFGAVPLNIIIIIPAGNVLLTANFLK